MDHSSTSEPTSLEGRTKRKLGVGLVFLGLACFVGSLAYVVILNATSGERPTAAAVAIVFLSWIVFFIGRSLIKSKGSHSSD